MLHLEIMEKKRWLGKLEEKISSRFWDDVVTSEVQLLAREVEPQISRGTIIPSDERSVEMIRPQ